MLEPTSPADPAPIRDDGGDDAAEVTVSQLRDVAARLIDAGHWSAGDPDILDAADAGYGASRPAWLLRDRAGTAAFGSGATARRRIPDAGCQRRAVAPRRVVPIQINT